MPLENWLELVLNHPDGREHAVFPDCCFPTAEHRAAYIASIKARKPEEFRNLLRRFLIPTGMAGGDMDSIMAALKENPHEAFKSERVCRTLRGEPPWEGVTWVLDLLHRPRMAIDVLHSYLAAHFWCMPDVRITGMFDAISLIRAAYLDTLHPRDDLLAIAPRDFELLVALLFSRRNFGVSLTPRSHDGGFDVGLVRTEAASVEATVVECKRYAKNVGVKEFRSLLGVVERDGSTKGMLVTTASFTTAAKKECALTNRIELIDYEKLCILFNEHFGPTWPTDILRLVSEAERKFEHQIGQN